MLLILMARQASDLVQLSLQDRSWIDQLEAIDLTCVRHSAFSGTEHTPTIRSHRTGLLSSVMGVSKYRRAFLQLNQIHLAHVPLFLVPLLPAR